jgi:hypothetical protein
MLKKMLILAVLVATAISPMLPRVFADSASWNTSVANTAWDYDYYRVERLALSDVADTYKVNETVFITNEAAGCHSLDICTLVDVTIFQNGQSLKIQNVDEHVGDIFWQKAQDGRFIYFIPSSDKQQWGTVYEYNSETQSVSKLTQLDRQDNGVAFMTFATDGDRIYSSTLHKDEQTGDIESQLSVSDYVSGYKRDDFTHTLTAPWQEIVDVSHGLALVKFEFDGGFEQLWLVDQTARSMEAISDTWTEPGGDIVGAHFLSDGSIRFFRNFRLWSYDPQTDTTPVDAGGAHLSWLTDTEQAIEIVGDRMAYIDEENGLYVSDLEGVRKFGMALNGTFNLDEEALYFQNKDGKYVGYTFSTNVWETRTYQVTDTYEDVLVGLDANGNVWYENTTNGYLLNIGYGAAPLLSDREHAYWKGIDGNLYEVTFSPLLDLERTEVEAFSPYDSTAVYLVSEGQIWSVPDPTVYFTWFDSWEDTVEVSPATIGVYLETYQNKGELKMAPGTRVKATSSKEVYVVGSDYKLHWMTSETVANEIYGSDWNQNIVTLKDTYLWKYAKGSNLTSGDDVRSI